jgi:Sporulation and spore germination
MIRTIRRIAAFAALALLAGCGITAEHAAQPIQPPSGVTLDSPTQPPEATSSGRAQEVLYFVKDDMVVKVTRHVTVAPTTQQIVTDLLAGPNDTETAAGHTSALLGDSVIDGVQITAGHAVVVLATLVADTARNDEVLAYAQLVCTLTALPQISGVTFTNNSQPVAVPRGDGSLSPLIAGQPVPLTAADYADLIGK